MSKYHLICGLEIHTELKTESKMFCGCKNDPFGTQPNSYTCPVCLGEPGGIPVPNKKAIEWTIKLGLFLGCKINLHSKFDRKNYFYPDLAKGYQISQYDLPFCYDGQIETSEGIVGIERIHLEEDTAKLIHSEIDGEKVSLIDFNRSGVPLVEIVTKPDIKTPTQAAQYAKKIREAVRYIGIGDGDMEKGGMRLEANISLQTEEQKQKGELPDYKVEVKNINSFNFMQQAVAYEVDRQSKLLDAGEKIEQETRGYNSDKQVTFSQRSKGNAADYRYFPDPDIPSFVFTKTQIENWRKELSPTPKVVGEKWLNEYGLQEKESNFFLENYDLASFASLLWKEAAAQKIDINKLAKMMINRKLTWQVDEPIAEIIERFLNETKTDDFDEKSTIEVVKNVLSENQDAVEKYKAGQKQVIGFFVGQTMKKIGKKVDVEKVKELIESQL
ncbi:MAG: Asp-tRNA(Asn)/Glu-tRNA(Gln) amidotransferase subunit GatB [Pseudomonadales bacterium]|jgi:aspartyl-tRNA(Asn)/glutamyl-tRNA(Gln) amidotransferase subunit B|nr:Asp-tRNA(Asn)/Glu-tRNA(Gln) amidotransferase subunit GatB [Pseudomonadales bacterium]